jgi:hypothetical protein
VKCPSIGGDATIYIKLAKAIEQGDLQSGLQSMRLNTFPVILATLHRVGFDWEAGGRWWGVVVSSLAVLPLFGWIRRQFDDYVAFAACFLYALHPRLIEWSPYVVRDPTFWFLFALSLYFIWRAVSEVCLSMFAAAGIVSTLAVMTRTEGILLLIPFAFWSLWRWIALEESRRRLLAGVLVCVFITPAILLLVNVTVLRDYSSWEFFRLPEFGLIENWDQSVGISVLESSDAGYDRVLNAPSSTGADRVERMSLNRMLHKYAGLMKDGFSPIYGLLLLGGIFNWRKIWFRWDNQPLFYVAVVIFVGIWLDYWYTGQSSTRYPLTIVLMSLPFAGLAVLGVTQWLSTLAIRFGLNNRWRKAVLFLPAVLLATVCFPEALRTSSNRYNTLEAYASVARWLRSQSEVEPVVLAHESVAKIVRHRTGFVTVPIYALDGPGHIVKTARDQKIDVVVLINRQLRFYDETKLLEELKKMGYQKVPQSDLPPGTNIVMVFLRKPADHQGAVEKPM